MNTLKTLHLTEAEPTEVVANSLNDELWTALRLGRCPPVLFKRFVGPIRGLCSDIAYSSEGEIEIDERFQYTIRTESMSSACRELVQTYIHETCHRLTWSHGHDAVFAALYCVFLLRANCLYEGLCTHLSLYDFQDHFALDAAIDASTAFAFIVKTGDELFASDLEGPALVVEIKRRWSEYINILERRPQIELKRLQEIGELQVQVAQARDSQLAWLAYGAIGGMAFASLAAYLFRT